jgi:septum site-determining protein MinD
MDSRKPKTSTPNSRILVITSGKGGVGKTTTTANLGMALAKRGKRVIVVDADFGLRNLDLLLGLENRVVYTAVEVIAGECRLEQAIVRDKRQNRLALLPAAQNRMKDAISPEQMKQLILKLATKFHYVIVDCPAGIEQGFQNAISAANEAIVVSTPEISSVRDADRVVGLLEANNIKKIHLVVNRLRPGMVEVNDMMSVEDVQEILSIPLIGVVPDDEKVIVSTNRGEPLVLAQKDQLSRAGEAFDNIARRLEGEKVEFLDLSPPKDTFLTRLRQLMSFKLF